MEMATKYNPLAGKKFVIIGGTSRIGLGVAELALSLQAIVFVGSSSRAKVTSAVQHLQASFPDGQVFGKAIDVTDETSLSDFIEWVKGTGEEGIHHVVLTASAHLVMGSIDQVDLEQFTKIYQTRLWGILVLARLLKPILKSGSSLTLTLGTVAYRPPPGFAAMASVAGAVDSLAKGLAVDFAPLVRVNAVCPGAVETPLWDPVMPPGSMRAKMIEELSSKLLTKRIGMPEDLAHAYIFLASSAFTTGQVIIVDGGHMVT